MGFVSKLSMNFFPKDGGGDAQAPGTVLASPDTQFGAGTIPAGPVSGTSPWSVMFSEGITSLGSGSVSWASGDTGMPSGEAGGGTVPLRVSLPKYWKNSPCGDSTMVVPELLSPVR